MRKHRQKEEVSDGYTAEHAAQVIAAHTAELATIARKAGLEPLAYILGMAALEAQTVLSPPEQQAA